jgi:Glycosyl hydrolase family 81 N-terminal domain
VGVNGGPHHKRKSSASGIADPLQDDKSLAYSLLHCQGKNPMVQIVGLVGCMTVCMVIFAVNLFPSGSETLADSMGSSKSELVKQFVQSFPVTDRSKSNDPADLFLRKELFHPDLHYSGSDPARIFNFAFPTGAFWTNLVLPPTADRGISYPIVVYPYAYKWSDRSLILSYPYNYRKEENIAIHDYFQPDLTFGVTQDTQSRYITNFDPLSVTLQYSTGSGSWKSYLVQGSPYVTIEYNSATPTIRALSTFKTVACPGEESLDSGEGGGDEFQDDFMDDDNVDSNRRRLLGVCGATVSSSIEVESVVS